MSCPKNRAAPSIRSRQLTTNAAVSWMLESIVENLMASFSDFLSLRSYFLAWTMDECRYRLCGMTVAPMMPSARNSAPLSVMTSFCGMKPPSISDMFGSDRMTSYRKITSTVMISVTTMASIFRKPNLASTRSRKTSSTVMMTPSMSGMPNSRFRATALPMTSAISVAMMASSATIHRAKPPFLPVFRRVAWAKSRPVTIPSLAHMLCRSIAIRLDIRMTLSSR